MQVLGSLKCDCREQLQLALDYVHNHPPGMVIYLQQEGRGIGLANKIAAYALQVGAGGLGGRWAALVVGGGLCGSSPRGARAARHVRCGCGLGNWGWQVCQAARQVDVDVDSATGAGMRRPPLQVPRQPGCCAAPTVVRRFSLPCCLPSLPPPAGERPGHRGRQPGAGATRRLPGVQRRQLHPAGAGCPEHPAHGEGPLGGGLKQAVPALCVGLGSLTITARDVLGELPHVRRPAVHVASSVMPAGAPNLGGGLVLTSGPHAVL